MNLHFMTHWPENMGGGPTRFPEKILASFSYKTLVQFFIEEHDIDFRFVHAIEELFEAHGYYFDIDAYKEYRELEQAKIHTIRPDKTKRWKKGTMIDFFIWTGKPYRSPSFRFAPRVPCTSVQNYTMKLMKGLSRRDPDSQEAVIVVDGFNVGTKTELSLSDGFVSHDHFLQWFDKDIENASLIHWTDKRY